MNTTPHTATNCSNVCPVRATANIIEQKWATQIIRDLLSGKKRFSELEKSLITISPKILTERLKKMEKYKIVSRTVYPTVPVTTEYELTHMGRKLESVIHAMNEFGILLLDTTNEQDTPN